MSRILAILVKVCLLFLVGAASASNQSIIHQKPVWISLTAFPAVVCEKLFGVSSHYCYTISVFSALGVGNTAETDSSLLLLLSCQWFPPGLREERMQQDRGLQQHLTKKRTPTGVRWKDDRQLPPPIGDLSSKGNGRRTSNSCRLLIIVLFSKNAPNFK